MIENGSDGFCAGGSTGEFMNLTREEWERVLQICKEQNRGRVPMLAGGGRAWPPRPPWSAAAFQSPSATTVF